MIASTINGKINYTSITIVLIQQCITSLSYYGNLLLFVILLLHYSIQSNSVPTTRRFPCVKILSSEIFTFLLQLVHVTQFQTVFFVHEDESKHSPSATTTSLHAHEQLGCTDTIHRRIFTVTGGHWRDNSRIVHFAHYDLTGSRLKPSIYVMRPCRSNACIARPSTRGYRAC